MSLRTFSAAAALVALPVLLADDLKTIDNREFASWAKHPAGTTIKLRQTSDLGGTTRVTEITQKLLSKADDDLEIELTTRQEPANELGGFTIKRTVKRRVKVSADKDPDAKPAGLVEEGTEEVTISGKKIKAKWQLVKASAGGTEAETKVWTSAEVPGLTVKSIAKLTAPIASTTTSELVEFKTP